MPLDEEPLEPRVQYFALLSHTITPILQMWKLKRERFQGFGGRKRQNQSLHSVCHTLGTFTLTCLLSRERHVGEFDSKQSQQGQAKRR